MITEVLEKIDGVQTDKERFVLLQDVSWEQLEAIEQALEGILSVRLTYLDGLLQIMSPISDEHEEQKSTVGLLLDIYLQEMGIRFYKRGAPTIGSKGIKARKEPDESYNIGTKKPIADIAIEVVITSGGINTLEIYKRLKVPEVWYWQKNQLKIYHLREEGYEQVQSSEFLPNLDLELLTRYLKYPDQYDAITEFRQELRKRKQK